jgi:hypothetical protein
MSMKYSLPGRKRSPDWKPRISISPEGVPAKTLLFSLAAWLGVSVASEMTVAFGPGSWTTLVQV